ncbi:MAG: TatD family deoxyribonuclease [Calditrichaeota bacterium]|nr:TatD family hydrolase [Calditrichota bacterium]RQW04347.1 MAG: TatD family deoxyribonuclease [Calditrichota bacterium]
MNFTDTHTHLHFDQYRDDLDEVIKRAGQAGIKKILTLGTDPASSRDTLSIAHRFEIVYAAVGIHPTDISDKPNEDTRRIRELIDQGNKIAAVGEIGLDLHWKEIPLEKQFPIFEQMLMLAAEKNLPVVIHNREAHPEMRRFLRERDFTRLRGVMHSFSGTANDAAFYMELGLMISFTGVITFKNFKDMDVVRSVPPDKLLLETDSPFLTPVPNRGKRNEPFNVRHIAVKLAEVHSLQLEEISEITCRNAASLFRWND